MADTIDPRLPELTPAELELVDAYLEVGCPLEEIAYTPYFDRLCDRLGFPQAAVPEKNRVFLRLTALQRKGRLPGLPPLTTLNETP